MTSRSALLGMLKNILQAKENDIRWKIFYLNNNKILWDFYEEVKCQTIPQSRGKQKYTSVKFLNHTRNSATLLGGRLWHITDVQYEMKDNQ